MLTVSGRALGGRFGAGALMGQLWQLTLVVGFSKSHKIKIFSNLKGDFTFRKDHVACKVLVDNLLFKCAKY